MSHEHRGPLIRQSDRRIRLITGPVWSGAGDEPLTSVSTSTMGSVPLPGSGQRCTVRCSDSPSGMLEDFRKASSGAVEGPGVHLCDPRGRLHVVGDCASGTRGRAVHPGVPKRHVGEGCQRSGCFAVIVRNDTDVHERVRGSIRDCGLSLLQGGIFDQNLATAGRLGHMDHDGVARDRSELYLQR